MSHGLDRIQWNNEGETMSHPLETSLSSRELVEQIEKLLSDRDIIRISWGDTKNAMTTLIDAWVRVREATILQAAADIKINNEDGTVSRPAQIFRNAILALATARKQIGEKI